jgi:CRP-like cAMP-binding protein
MQRKVISLSKDTVLWEAGDTARNVAVVNKGKLAARTEQGVVGIILPNMVLGETALFGDEGSSVRRTATIVALEEETVVTEYAASEVRLAFEGGDDALMHQVVQNLVGQIARNLAMVVSARRGYAFIDGPLTGLLEGLVRDAQQAPAIRTWDTLLATCRFLHDLRDLSDRLLDRLGPAPGERGDLLENASQMVTQLGGGQDIQPVLEAFLNAEMEKSQWWMRSNHS